MAGVEPLGGAAAQHVQAHGPPVRAPQERAQDGAAEAPALVAGGEVEVFEPVAAVLGGPEGDAPRERPAAHDRRGVGRREGVPQPLPHAVLVVAPEALQVRAHDLGPYLHEGVEIRRGGGAQRPLRDVGPAARPRTVSRHLCPHGGNMSYEVRRPERGFAVAPPWRRRPSRRRRPPCRRRPSRRVGVPLGEAAPSPYRPVRSLRPVRPARSLRRSGHSVRPARSPCAPRPFSPPVQPVPARQDRLREGPPRLPGLRAPVVVDQDEIDVAQRGEPRPLGHPDEARRDQAPRVRHDPEARAGRRDEPVEAPARARDAVRAALALQDAQRPIAGDAGRRVHDERERSLRVEPQPLARDPHERVAPHQHPVRLLGPPLGEHEIETPLGEPLVERPRQLHGQLQVHFRVRPPEGLQDLREPRQHEVLGGPEAQSPAQPRPREVRRRLLLHREEAPREAEHRLAVLGERDRVRVPDEERPPGLLLQAPHVLAHRRLPHPEPLRGPREAERLRHGEEGAQVGGLVHGGGV
ncbi:putative LysR family transcriptional regulator [Streptomyces sp. Tu6071]|nr:putative LysR family transcriptional regulator [Streptomyces sp. Tu6071]